MAKVIVQKSSSPGFVFFSSTFYFVLEYNQLTNNVIVSGEWQRDSAIHIRISILPHNLLPSRLPHNTKQSSLCCTVSPCWLSVLNIALCTCPYKLPNSSFPTATISLFSESVSLFLFCKYVHLYIYF